MLRSTSQMDCSAILAIFWKNPKLVQGLDIDQLPAGPVLATRDRDLRRAFTLAGGDDYELCFTAPESNRDAVIAAGKASADHRHPRRENRSRARLAPSSITMVKPISINSVASIIFVRSK